MSIQNNFAAFILTHGRPDKVYTYNTLKRNGFTGKIFLIVDDLDKTKEKYIKEYGSEVVIFNKKEVAKTFDQADNFDDMRAIVYARNACFDIAKNLGIEYFIQLDDDYTKFEFRFDDTLKYKASCFKNKNLDSFKNKNLDRTFSSILEFYISSGVSSISLAQGGDFIGGSSNANAVRPRLIRKCMNSFFCSIHRPFKFLGRINEDVNTYTKSASIGLLLFTTNQVSLTQKQTQSNSGGMTELYKVSGTYVKSFYSVMFQPSSVTVGVMGDSYKRLHHKVSWDNTVPKILDPIHKK